MRLTSYLIFVYKNGYKKCMQINEDFDPFDILEFMRKKENKKLVKVETMKGY